MKTAALELELLDDLVISARAASIGGHGSLDYIPGATLLGWVATQLYRELSAAGLAFDAFHSGRLRFGNGLPLDIHGSEGWPVPRCWSHPKGKDPDSVRGGGTRRVLDGEIRNELRYEAEDHRHTLSEGFVVPHSGEWLKPARTLRMRTAIHPTRGRAAEGQLFGYQSLSAGQRFRALLSADDDLPAGLFERVRDCLGDADAVLHLGRSRSAQYGRVHCTLGAPSPTVPAAGVGKDRLTLWLLSDLAALDRHGQPTLSPQLDWLAPGLPKGKLALSKTYIATRRYSPYNGYRRARDLERQVIQQGSVLTFIDLDPPLSKEHLSVLAAGIGAYREAGLGAVLVNPPLLDDPQPVWRGKIVDAPSEPVPIPQHELVEWLSRQHASDEESYKGASPQDRQEVESLYRAACRHAGAPPKTLVGPGNSQWGRAVQAAVDGRDQSSERLLIDRLFNPDHGICRDKHNESWGKTTQLPDSKELTTFRDWLQGQVEDSDDPLGLLDSLARLAKDYIRREVRS